MRQAKVRTFWETHQIWKKNLPHGFDKSAENQDHEEDFFQIMCASQKVRALIWLTYNFATGTSDFTHPTVLNVTFS